MKKVAILVAVVVGSMSLAGCFVGKGKAPVVAPRPAPVITKG